MTSLRSINSLSHWLRLLLGLNVIFGLFQWSAGALASNRGEAGLIVGLLVVSATIAAERLLAPSWLDLPNPGLFAQAGVAEKILFRGYLFGHLRPGRSFWRAATISMLPFVGVHLFLFPRMYSR